MEIKGEPDHAASPWQQAQNEVDGKVLSGGLPRSATEMEIKGEPDHAASPLQQALIDF